MQPRIGKPAVLASGSCPDIVSTPDGIQIVYKDAETGHLILLDGSKSTILSQDATIQRPRLSYIKNKLILAYESNGQIISQSEVLGNGHCPGRIVRIDKYWLMGYHIQDRTGNLVQMIARSTDGESWRDRWTVAADRMCDFCEGSLVPIDKNKIVCYFSETRGARGRIHVCLSLDRGLSWSAPSQMALLGRHLSAAIKTQEPHAGLILAVFTNLADHSLSLMIQNYHRKNIQVFPLDIETNTEDFGFANWIETTNGIRIVYHMRRSQSKPMIYSLDVGF